MAIAKNMRSTNPLPFGFNPKVEHRNSRLRRYIRSHGKPSAEQQGAALKAYAIHPVAPHPQP